MMYDFFLLIKLTNQKSLNLPYASELVPAVWIRLVHKLYFLFVP